MEFSVEFDEIAKNRAIRDNISAVAHANAKTVRANGGRIKADLRRQTKKTLGDKLANTWKNDAYPARGGAREPAVMIYSKFKHMWTFDQGIEIRAKGGKWLAIPTDDVGRRGNKRLTPRDFPQGSLVFKLKDNSTAYLVQQKKGEKKGIVMFILKRKVRVRKQIEIMGTAEKHAKKIPTQYTSILKKEQDKRRL